MANIAFFIKQLTPHIVRKNITYTDISTALSISLFDDTTLDPQGQHIYIGNSCDAPKLFQLLPPQAQATFFLSGDSPELPAYFNRNFNIIATDLSLVELYRRISHILNSYQEWTRALLNTLREDNSLEHILDLVGDMLKGHIFLFNPGIHLLAANNRDYFPDPIAQEARSEGFLSYETMQKLTACMENSDMYPNEVRHVCPDSTGHPLYLHTISYQGTEVATLMFIVENTDYQLDIANVLSQTGTFLRPLLLQNMDVQHLSEDHLSRLLKDFDTAKVLSAVEIRDRIRLLPYPCKPYIRCAIVTFRGEQPKASYNLLLNRLAQLMPRTNMTIWDNAIVILLSSDTQEYKNITGDYLDDWNDLLEEFHAQALISNSSRFHDAFRIIYYLNARLSRILARMEISGPRENILFYDDYILYLVMDMAAEQFKHTLGSNDIIQLCAPAVFTLTYYDQQHHTNLRNVLFHYLHNDGSVSKTAEALYMHRNTVLNKLKKIQELCPLDLENGISMEILMFSCQLVKYYEEYMHLELRF